ncbi:hypothetical protein BD324DRAFT_621356 [Kockovaella imperatae]|uniref:Mitochondrial intermembrane space import and assembly protein 40 n=1 Tax=Kockovaella imperatae TaxID=4999 RepID=A0A1Y1UM07_9TREE|nr:hypothetical protein BD324DRAFT_621356 [Kockovaella imperatae]ORX38557.1 hypothetical protein BD324DRAFT_621356 [Kockovaella imperatae]
MLSSTLRSTTGRTLSRQLVNLKPGSKASNNRHYATFQPYTPPPNTSARSIILFGLGVAGLGAGAYYFSQQGRGVIIKYLPPYDLPSSPDHSVLAKGSLKEPGIHSRSGPSEAAKSVHPVLKQSSESAPAQAPSAMKEKLAEASDPSEGAFNEETGEINWDCPCLGGMADGPCGEDFKAAFSCFVFSEAEPKGMDCVEKFKAMQDCFREHPDVYGEEIEDDDDTPASSSKSSAPSSKDDDSPAHPIPGNPVGDTRTPRQREQGLPGVPKDTPPENSPVHSATPNNSPKKGPKHIEK